MVRRKQTRNKGADADEDAATQHRGIFVLAATVVGCCFVYSSVMLNEVECSMETTRSKDVMGAMSCSAKRFWRTRLVPEATSEGSDNKNVDDNQLALADKMTRYLKYIHKYNYTAPWKVWNNAPAECGTAPAFAEFFSQNAAKHSRFGEDKFIWEHFFKGRLEGPGTYVELGAFDGTQESNTRFYDICLGWKGLLLEGQPTVYFKTRENRPQTHRMSFAPSCSSEYEATNKTVQFFVHPLTNSGLEGSALTYSGRATIAVPCGPLGPVLEDIFHPENRRINFFSLDVEGAEPMVLRTIDFSKVHIDVLMIEVENNDCPKRRFCQSRNDTREIMHNAGYKRYENLVLASDVYVHPDSVYQLQDPPPVG